MNRIVLKGIWNLEMWHLIALMLIPLVHQGQVRHHENQHSIGFRISAEGGRVEIPFTSIHNLIVIPVSINGSTPFNFILDCGVSYTIITEPTLAGLMGLNPEREMNILGAGGDHQIKANICTNNQIEFKGVKGEGVPIILLQEDYLSLSSMLGIPIYGLLGSDVFQDLVIGIDYVDRRLTIMDPARFSPPHGYMKVPVRIQNGKPHFNLALVQTEGPSIEIEVMADLGASHFLLLETENDTRLKIPSKQIEANVGFGLAGPIRGSYARASSVMLGSARIKNPIVSYTDQYAPAETPSRRQGTVGGEFMCRFNIWFDLSRGLVYLQKNRQFKRSFSQDRSGLGVLAEGQELQEVIVYDVRLYSPAWKAGIQVGDRIIKVNGAKIRGLDRINTIMRRKEGKKIHMVFERDGRVQETRFRLMKGL